MNRKTMAALVLTGFAIVATSATPAMARPHRHQVCNVIHDHHHTKRICHWVG